MRNIEVYVNTNKVGSRCSETIEVEDDATDDEINQLAHETMLEMIEWDWKELPE